MTPLHLNDILQYRASHQRNRLAYTFLADDNQEVGYLTYGLLDRVAKIIASFLCQHGEPGDRVLILLPPGLDFISAFMGCLYAERIAVPCPPPDGSRLKRTLPRLRAIAVDAGTKVLIANQKILDLLEENRAGLHVFEDMTKLAMDHFPNQTTHFSPRTITPETPAFLQYTSGSTSTPKGVVITHANLMVNSEYIHQSGRYTPDRITCTWMPHVHDYGLIDGLLQPLYSGIPCYFMSPMTFLKRPLRWLQAISKYRVTHSHAPNFAFDYCVDRIPPEAREGLDLSCWIAASNAAEPVRPDTLKRFMEAFGPYGFREETFCPTYGLAEATLLVATGPYGGKPVRLNIEAAAMEQNQIRVAKAPGDGVLSLVGVGQPVGAMKLEIVDPETLSRADADQVGEIWLSDPSIANGYWNRPEENAINFGAYLADTGEGPFLRTGDLGFVHEGELYIAGRLKDLIIVRGRNHYPHDIEETVAASHEDLTANLAAFTLDHEGEERLVIAAELGRKAQKRLATDEIAEAVTAALWEGHDLLLESLVLLKPGSLPKTSSGKVQRRACKAGYLEGELEVVAVWTRPMRAEKVPVLPQNEEQVLLKGIWEEVLGVKQICIDDHFLALGGHSLSAARMAAQVRVTFGLELQPTDIFSAPTIRQLAARLSELESSTVLTLPQLTLERARLEEIPLSFAQQRLWFLSQLEGPSPAYHIASARQLRGIVYPRLLEQAFGQITQRHEILRTCFAQGSQEPCQRILPVAPFVLPVIDLSGLSREERELEKNRLVAAHADLVFPIDKAPLYRFHLVRVSPTESVLLLNIHHIITDGWSMDVLCRELGDGYRAGFAMHAPMQPEIPIQYADYAIWQRQWLTGEVLERQMAYWRGQLEGASAFLDLPIKGARPQQVRPEGAALTFFIPQSLAVDLRQLAVLNHTTLFLVLEAAFAELLGRYAQSQDVNVGTPVANRRYAELEGLIGFFVNTLVMRNRLGTQETVRERIKSVHEMALAAFAHQDVPFEKLVEALNPVRDLSRTPLFQVMFALHSASSGLLDLEGVKVRTLPQEKRLLPFELALTLKENVKGMDGLLEYNPQLFEAAWIGAMAEQFVLLLTQFVTRPDDRVSRLSLLSETATAQVLAALTGPSLGYAGLDVLALFAHHVRVQPDAPALIYEEVARSYRELDAEVRAVAAGLRAQGIGPEQVVGIALDRGPDLVVALLAVWSAGAAFLTLDARYPQERLLYMVADSGCQLLLGDPETVGRLGLDGVAVPVWRLNAVAEKGVSLDHRFEADHAAYVMYTSGSTGQPKGVVVSYAAIGNRLVWAQQVYPLATEHRFLHTASFAFDIAVWELWAPLLGGAASVLAPASAVGQPEELLARMARFGVTHVHMVPSLLEAFLEVADLSPAGTLSHLFCGGEAVALELIHRTKQRLGVRFIQFYGPTEGAINVTAGEGSEETARVTLGEPIAHAWLRVADRHLQLVPVGVAGELLMGGMGLARGYQGKSAQTAERFVPDPWATEVGARLYRTGDRVSLKPDGLVFMGRLDHQVKLRGLRIELGEIEALLHAQEGVGRAVVQVVTHLGEPRLAAFVQPNEETSVSERNLRSALETRLPAYMVPTLWVLAPLPLLPNGKVNQQGLLRLLPLETVLETVVVPETPEAVALAGIWAELLGREVASISAHANFFELGGHSLLATRLVTRIRNVFEMELAVREVFEHPTLAALAERIRVQNHELPHFDPPVPVGRERTLPLSFPQQRLFFLFQLEGPSPTYNMPGAFRVAGPLDVQGLVWAFDAVCARHENLRTRFVWADGVVAQQIEEEAKLQVVTVDLSDMTAAQQELQLSQLVGAHARAVFDLNQPGFLRVALVRLAAQSHVLLFNQHHIASDGWSTGVLVAELGAFYRAHVTGSSVALAPLTLQYADYAVWQQKLMEKEVMHQQVAYWSKQLQDAPTVLDLPYVGQRPSVQTANGGTVTFQVPAGMTNRLRSLAHLHQASLFMVLEAVFAELLGRYSGAPEILIGTPVANRRFAELEPLIGFFVNTLVLRNRLARVSGQERIRELRETALSAFAHQDLPFEKLVEVLNPVRDQSRSPLFQVLFALQTTEYPIPALEGLLLLTIPQQVVLSKFDLSLTLLEGLGGLTGLFEYNTDLFDGALIQGMVGHYLCLLEGFVTHPDQAVCHYEFLAEAERQQLLVGFNDAAPIPPGAEGLHLAIYAQAERRPQHKVLSAEDGTLTYSELCSRAQMLARQLRAMGVGSETRVAILMDRGVDLVVGLLGILSAGATYVPLDPAYPLDRLRYMLVDSGAALLLSREAVLSRIGLDTPVPVWDWVAMARVPHAEAALVPVAPEQLAYLIYTSGSTGKPKAVAIPHRAATGFLTWAATVFRADDLRGVLGGTSVCFDLSIFELFLPLREGGGLIFVADVLALGKLSQPERVSLINTVPSAAAELVRHEWLPPKLRVINLAGEPLSAQLVDQLYQHPGLERVFDLYGPSEDTTYSTFALRQVQRPATIGRAIGGSQVYLLDRHLHLVARGAAGELTLGGIGLARGYLNRPSQTASVFVPNPFSSVPGSRLYRTGDLALHYPDGNLKLLGRLDHQVKLRGFRIELGEIETHLLSLPGVSLALAMVADHAGDKRLVAFVENPEMVLAPPPIRSFLEPRLPAYMIPSTILVMEVFPLLPNGKINRAALLKGLAGARLEHLEMEAPSTHEEEVMRGIWSELLGVETSRIGIRSHFFELGGHSLLATRLTTAIRDTFGVELALREVFAHPTLHELAARIPVSRQQGPAMVAPVPVRRDQPLPLSFAQERLWFLSQLEGPSATYNLPTALELRGPLDVQGLEHCFARIIMRHESLRTTFSEVKGQTWQVVHPYAGFRLDVFEAGPQAAVRVQAAQERAAFDLVRGPLLRVVLIRHQAEAHTLVLNQHHIISDGWSLGILVKELSHYYRAVFYSSLDLNPLPVQYADFAVWQRQLSKSQNFSKQIQYWQTQLAELPPAPDLPYQGVRPAVQTHAGATFPVELSPLKTQALNRLAQENHATLFMVVEAAFSELLGRYTGASEIMMGTPVANRRFTELEPLMGFFVNTLVLRNYRAAQHTVQDRIRLVRETALAAFANQDVPFEQLVELVNPVRDPSRSPLFQTLFVLQNQDLEGLSLHGLQTRVLPQKQVFAKFDLSLNLRESAGSLVGALEYNTDLFEPNLILAMIQHLNQLLRAFIAFPTEKVCHLSLLSESEQTLILEHWNQTEFQRLPERTIHRAFMAQAKRTPAAVALSTSGHRIRYEELDAWSNGLAVTLRNLGCGPDCLVGILLERDRYLLKSLLGVLKAGGAYVPLDPQYPADRLRFMLEDAGCQIVVTETRFQHLLADLPGILAICLDNEQVKPQEEWRRVWIDGDNLAYLNFTSGTTGRPKAVQISHNNVLRLVSDRTYVCLDESDTVAQISNPSFDALTFEVWTSWLTGARLHVIERESLLDLAALDAVIRRERVTSMFVTVALFNECIRFNPAMFQGVRYLLFGGERASTDHVALAYEGGKPEHLVHIYGPTETTTFAVWYDVAAVPSRDQGLPLGQPISETLLYVLDPQLELVPIGAPGELCLGGAGLSRGYRNRPGLTAERFVPDPFASYSPNRASSGSRVYRTGDLVRWLKDGQIGFIGRIGSQVKIRGFRIEPDEIRAVIQGHPNVDDAVVLVDEQVTGKRLIGAFTQSVLALEDAAWQENPERALNRYLSQILPEYMVPAQLLVLEQMPMNANGKVDQRYLRELAMTQPDAQVVPLSTATEYRLGEIWAELLGCDVSLIHAQSNFFSLGGHSLLATRLVSAIRVQFAMEFPLADVFAAPGLAALASKIDSRSASGDVLPAPVAGPRPERIPLAFAQKRLWFLDRFEGASTTYHIPSLLRLEGPLDVDRLEAVLGKIVARHESLRTRFVAIDDQPYQVIDPYVGFSLVREDLRHGDEGERQAVLEARLQAALAEPFDLEQGPLFRATLFTTGQDEAVLLLNQHHIISDGWSMGLLVRELASYGSVDGEDGLAPLPIQYADYALWQHDVLLPRLAAQVVYWKEALAGAPPSLDLPTKGPRPLQQSYRGASLPFEFSLTLSAEMRRFALTTETTPFMVLQAVFAELLGRYAGVRDLTIGTPIANRRFVELEPLIGFFVNTLVLRHTMVGRQTVLQRLLQTRAMILAAFAHQDVPFEQLVEAVNPARDPSRSPLFQVMCILQNNELELPSWEGLALTAYTPPNTVSKFDLTLNVREENQVFMGVLEYATDLFEVQAMQTLIDQLQVLLQAFVTQPNHRVCDLSFLTEAMAQALLVELNQTELAYEEPAGLFAGFQRNRLLMPDAEALVCGKQSLSYAALGRRVDQVVEALLAQGIKPEDRVAVLMERHAELIISLLAILTVGAAYVPLDPNYPQERLSFMLADSDAALLLTTLPTLSRSNLQPRCRILYYEKLEPFSGTLPALPKVFPEQLAYLIYTSGSTGKPKAVAISHRPAGALLAWAQTVYSPDDLKAVLAGTSVCFDLSVYEIFLPLTVGGTVFLVPDVLALGTLAHRDRITLVNTVPSAAAELVAQGWLPAHLRVINLAGEPLSSQLVDALYEHPGLDRVYDLYGPSEDTTYSTFVLRRPGGPVTIGRPIANSQIYLMDAFFQPVPWGAAGELVIGGLGLARGYLQAPAQTAGRFVPNPFTSEPGLRIYRTGDLACYRPDGSLKLIGRIDHQVKLRGFRIELGEIEAWLEKLEPVGKAVVLVEGSGATQRLVGCVQMAEGSGLDVSDLKAYLHRCVPGYMVPTQFVLLAAMPLLPNGKVDRSVLKKLAEANTDTGSMVDAPATLVEDRLAGIWSDLLERSEPIGRDHHFFDLGGHSLLATRLVAQIRKGFGVDLALRDVFEHPQLGQLAELIQQQTGTEPELLPPVPHNLKDNVPLSFAQQRLWFLAKLEGPSATYTMPITLRLTGKLCSDQVEKAFRRIVARHGSLRTTFTESENGTFQIVHESVPFDLTVIDVSQLPSTQARDMASQILNRNILIPFDLVQGPLFRAHLVRVEKEEHWLLLNQHHIITDGWSLGVLVHEFKSYYPYLVETERDDDPTQLPSLAVHYADYAIWQQGWLHSGLMERQLNYWKAVLGELPPPVDLPRKGPRPLVQTSVGRTLSFGFGVPVTRLVLELARTLDATLFMVLEAVFAEVLGRYTGLNDVTVGTPVANRRYEELEPLIGFFVNTLVLRNRQDAHATVAERIEATRAMCLGAFAHQDLPFEKLVEAVNPVRDTSRSPLFQLMFTLLSSEMRLSRLPGLDVDLLPTDLTSAKFDMSWFLRLEDDELRAEVQFNTDLYESSAVAQLFEHFARLAEGFSVSPNRPVCLVSILGQDELNQLLCEFNQTDNPFPHQGTLHELVSYQGRLVPDQLALVSDEASFTYAQMAERVTLLAAYLRTLGCGPESIVGVALPKSPMVVMSLLAIMEAGASYLPLDPTYPSERLAMMIEDSHCSLIITQEDSAPVLPTSSGCQLILVENLNDLEMQAFVDIPFAVLPEQIAYVIYTSGSTGRPKGVQIPHRGAVNLIQSTSATYSLGPGSRLLQFASLSFDASVWEIFMALGSGATLHIAPQAQLYPGPELEALCDARQLTHLFLPPGALSVMDPSKIQSVTHVFVGGDVCTEAHARTWAGHRHLFNAYGPTEVSVCVTTVRVAPEKGTPTLGGPIHNIQAYVLDANHTLLPRVAVGELVLGGVGLARGYLNRPSLTAQQFVPNPFSAEPGSRLYKTGDLVRWSASGELVYCGRRDHQVKLRGFRIELGEIEAAILQNPLVSEVVALVREDSVGQKRLVCYLVAPKTLDLELLRDNLRQGLPSYMVPSAMILLESIPLNKSGKLDRAALPVPQAESVRVLAIPRNDLERKILEVWQEVLGHPGIGIRDNFFDMGGNSLLMAQVHRQLEARGIEVRMVELFQNPTVFDLALFLSRKKTTVDSREEVERSDKRKAAMARRQQRPGNKR